jgi:site-specific DNA-cytosine methylase
MKVASLFSGAGALDYGLEQVRKTLMYHFSIRVVVMDVLMQLLSLTA